MTTTLQLKRGTRAKIDALASTGGLLEGEPLFITDENRFAVAKSSSNYGAVALTTSQNIVPNKPSFNAIAGSPIVPGNDVTYPSSVFNIDNCLNITNGRFTAPINGVYFFRYHQLALYADSGEYRTAIYKNGVGYGGLRFITVKPANTWWSLRAEGHVYMNANEYVTVRYESGPGNLYTDANYGTFSGHFIG